MQSKSFVVPNISCGHCTRTIEMEVEELNGVESVTADVDSRRVTITWGEPASWDQIDALLREINYPPADTIHAS